MTDETQGIRRRLLDLQQELAREAVEHVPETVELDQTRVGRLSRMDAMQSQAMSQAAAQRRQMRLRQVDAALERLEQGDYGICRNCDTHINPRRLAIDPLAVLCIDCASRSER